MSGREGMMGPHGMSPRRTRGVNRHTPLASLRWGALLLALAGCAPGSGLEGTVQDRNGNPLPGVEILLFDRRVEELTPERSLARAVADGSGRFRLAAAPEGDALLKVRGAQGAGRLRVGSHRTASPLTIVYPVVETIVFLHDNDTHFNLNHREAFRARIEEIRSRNPDVFLLSAGDIFIRHPDRWPVKTREYYRERSRFMIEAMNKLGYDAATPGNHELDYIDHLTRESLELAKFPLLGANVEIATEALPRLHPYVVLETSTRRTIAVLGLSVVNFRKEGVLARDPVETALEYVHLAREHDLFMALTHIGIRVDRALAERVPELDLIIGGHSHTLLPEAEHVNSVLVAQAGGVPGGHPVRDTLPKFLGEVTLTLENGRIVEKGGRVTILFGETAARRLPDDSQARDGSLPLKASVWDAEVFQIPLQLILADELDSAYTEAAGGSHVIGPVVHEHGFRRIRIHATQGLPVDGEIGLHALHLEGEDVVVELVHQRLDLFQP